MTIKRLARQLSLKQVNKWPESRMFNDDTWQTQVLMYCQCHSGACVSLKQYRKRPRQATHETGMVTYITDTQLNSREGGR